MKSQLPSQFFFNLVLAAVVCFTIGCGESGTQGQAPDPAEVAALEAKVAEGDADAAMKLGELFAQDSANNESRITAAKWFHVAGRLGNANAGVALNTVTSGMDGDALAEAELRASAVKIPQK